jgi:mono/diheme cytochrome c family protein
VSVVPPAPDGRKIFASAGCLGCHALRDAHSAATIGPDLDNARPDVPTIVAMSPSTAIRCPRSGGS